MQDNPKVATVFFPYELLSGRQRMGTLEDGPNTNKNEVVVAWQFPLIASTCPSLVSFLCILVSTTEDVRKDAGTYNMRMLSSSFVESKNK